MEVGKFFIGSLGMKLAISKFLKKESKGTTAIEYALIACLIAVVAITAMTKIGNQVSRTLNSVANTLEDANNNSH